MASTPDAQTGALVARVSRSVAIRSARRRRSAIRMSTRFCASLSAYRGAAVLFKVSDVLVAAAQPISGLVGGFGGPARFNAHGAERDDGAAVKWCARCLASQRHIARKYAVNMASPAAGQKSQYWAKPQDSEVVHAATPTLVPPAPRLGGLRSSFQRSCVWTRVGDYSTTTRLVRPPGRPRPLMDQTIGAGSLSTTSAGPELGWHFPIPRCFSGY